MPRAALIQDGKVVNLVAANDNEIGPNVVAVGNQPVAIGWLYSDGAFTQVDPPVVIPQEVTMRQARLALLNAGKLAQVQPAIDAMSEPQKSAAQIEWDYSNTVQRNNAFVGLLGAALGMSAAELDSLFVTASAL